MECKKVWKFEKVYGDKNVCKSQRVCECRKVYDF